MHHLLTFSCTLSDEKKWQPICSESKYGTHYLIYARFEVSDLPKDSTKKEVKKIHIHLQNYTGAVTIGIDSVSIPEWGETADGTTEMFILKVNVKALFFNESETVVIPSGKMIVSEKQEMETFVTVVENENSNIIDNSSRETRNKAIFVDEEFYKRDGEEVIQLKDNEKGPRNCRAIRSTFYF